MSDLAGIFSEIYHKNFWKDSESVSGQGSNMAATEAVRRELPTLCKQLGINSLLDIPCGDFYWMSTILNDLGLDWYVGADIVPELVLEVSDKYRDAGLYPRPEFVLLDAVGGRLPSVDLILCRDMLGHLSNMEIRQCIKNFRASGSLYLLATTFPERDNANTDIEAGQWRPVNLADWRFGLGKPLLLINENSTEGKGKFADKSLGLWMFGKEK